MNAVDDLHRDAWGRVVASLVRRLGDLQLAEDAAQDAFAAALAQWPVGGVPDNPVAWLIATARHKAVDHQRRVAMVARKEPALVATFDDHDRDDDLVPLDPLRLVFTCCHPALARDTRVALTLRTVCGLEVSEIARAFLVPEATLAKRLVRARAKIKTAGIPFVVPDGDALAERLGAVLEVVYLVFNEGYFASFGDDLLRLDLCADAIRLARMIVELLPAEREARGLLALMVLHHARRETRIDADGAIVPLDEQDRTRWDPVAIAEGRALVVTALRGGRPGEYAVQAAIAALHAEAPTAGDTDWPQIAALYGVLAGLRPSSQVVALNRAVATAMVDGLERGLLAIAGIRLPDYHLVHAVRADLLRRLGRDAEAASAYQDALALVTNAAERKLLERRLAGVLAAAARSTPG